MKKILARVLGVTDPRAPLVRGDLQSRLDGVQKGLGAAAVEYVMQGGDGTVLASLGALSGRISLDVAEPWAHHAGTRMRREMLAQREADVALHAKYAEVLSAATPTLPKSAAGSDKVPVSMRALFTEMFAGVNDMNNSWPRKAPKPGRIKFTPDHALAVTTALDGTAADLFDLVYNGAGGWSSIDGTLWRQTFDLRQLASCHRDGFVAAGTRVIAAGRAEMITELARWELVGEAPFTGFVLDQAGSSAKSAREAAVAALKSADPRAVEPGAIERLQTGNIAARAGMVEVLAALGTDTALAALDQRRAVETSARVSSQIENHLMVHDQSTATHGGDDADGYTALDGSRVEVPALNPLPGGAFRPLGKAEAAELVAMIDAENVRIEEANKQRTGQYSYREQKLNPSRISKAVLQMMNAPDATWSQDGWHFLSFHPDAQKWARARLAEMPQDHALNVAVKAARGGLATGGWTPTDPFHEFVSSFLDGTHGDFRHLDAAWVATGVEMRLGDWHKSITRKARPGDLMRQFIDDSYWGPAPGDFPRDALWPYVAARLDVLDEALGLAPATVVPLNRVAAVGMLSALPKTPMRYMGALLEIATGTTKGGRAEARALLADAPGVTDRLVDLLSDARQAVRAGVADWLGTRGETGAVKPLKARLKKEKSDLARAAMLTALDRLGQDMGDYLGPKALLAEAEKGMAKARFDKLDWLSLSQTPAATYRSGRAVPPQVLGWWIFLATKLKQPGGNTLFDIYLDQLSPASAEAFSTWLLESWIANDTTRPSIEDAEAHAARNAQIRYQTMKRWIDNYSVEQAHAELHREFMGQYMSSGTATKGLLGLAKRAAPTVAADRVRAYLKAHGSRTSQASSLLEMLAAMGDAVSLQVVIMAATRLKQKSVQKLAGELVQRVAEDKGWSMDELSDRTIPVAGLDDDGVLDLPCGDRVFTARLDDDFRLQVFNPDGKPVKALPGGGDDATKASKKQLSASKKELKQVVQMQSMRLYEALCAEREWALDDWQRDFRDHPVMKRLTERVVWLGVDGAATTAFRPTPEGDCTDAQDAPVDPAAFPAIRLAHGALVDDDQAWITHLEDYEVKPLFAQFGRTLLHLPDGQGAELAITDRKGWVTDTFTLRGAASRLGYERGEALDAGFFCDYVKTFQSAGLKAVIEFTGNCLPEDNVPAALISLSFQTEGRGRGGPMRLDKVPPVLLSECWNDYHDMAAKAAFDADWEAKMPW